MALIEIKRDHENELKAYVPLSMHDLEEILIAMNYFEPDAMYQYQYEMEFSEQITEKKYNTLIDSREIISDAKDAIQAVIEAMVKGQV